MHLVPLWRYFPRKVLSLGNMGPALSLGVGLRFVFSFWPPRTDLFLPRMSWYPWNWEQNKWSLPSGRCFCQKISHRDKERKWQATGKSEQEKKHKYYKEWRKKKKNTGLYTYYCNVTDRTEPTACDADSMSCTMVQMCNNVENGLCYALSRTNVGSFYTVHCLSNFIYIIKFIIYL